MIIDKIVALLDGLDSTELDQLPPARQRKFADLLRHWQQAVERRLQQQPKAGVLRDLTDGKRSE